MWGTQKKESIQVRSVEPLLSLSFLRSRIAPDLQEAFVEDTRTCLDCGSKVTLDEDELVCTSCGRVWSDNIKVETVGIPFETESMEQGHAEGHFSPISELAFGRGLGPGVDGRQLFRILAQAKTGNTDLPLRAMQIRLITSKLDHPTVQTMLGYGSTLMKEHGMHTNEDFHVLFATMLGKLLRKIAGYYVIRGQNCGELRRVANSVFYILYVGNGHSNEAEKLFEELNLSKELLDYVQRLLQFLECPKVQKKPKQKQKEV